MKTTLPVRRRRGAFTLIEIMIVVGIIGLLAVALVPALTKDQETVRLKLIQTNLQRIHAAKVLWALEHRKGPGDLPSASDLDGFGGMPKAIAGETYSIEPIGTPPSAALKGKMGPYSANGVLTLPEE